MGRGCLQDVHWALGLFGYFPTYTVGAMIAAQLFAAAGREDADILPALAQGSFAPLTAWLRAHVHSQGSRPESFDALLAQATGRAAPRPRPSWRICAAAIFIRNADMYARSTLAIRGLAQLETYTSVSSRQGCGHERERG